MWGIGVMSPRKKQHETSEDVHISGSQIMTYISQKEKKRKRADKDTKLSRPKKSSDNFYILV